MNTEKQANPSSKLTREDVAKIELGQTDVSASVAWFLLLALLVSMVAVPLVQHASDLRANLKTWKATPAADRHWHQLLPQVYDIVRLVPDGEKIRRAGNWRDLVATLPSSDDIKRYETAVEDNSVLAKTMIPEVQWLLTRFGGSGNEEAVTGRDGWLFYKPGMKYLTDQPFLAKDRLRDITRFTDITPDPIPALIDFRDQLAARGIELVVMPTPVKAQIHPEMLAGRFGQPEHPLQNPSYAEWMKRLEAAGVTVFDPAPILLAARSGEGAPPVYLATDTHWTPPAMERVADALADFLRARFDLPAAENGQFTRQAVTLSNAGDIAVMLHLPEDQTLFPEQTVTIQEVQAADGQAWEPDVEAPVLLLGDSFTNIYAMPDLKWGEHAGLAEQLSFRLGLPVDRIAINAGGSHATREELASRIRRHYAAFDRDGSAPGREPLADKKVLVYEFATRELLQGDWKLIALPPMREEALGAARAPVESGKTTGAVVRGRIEAISTPPRPGTVPYREAVIALHLLDARVVKGDVEVSAEGALVYLMGMADNKLTAAAALRPGDEVELRIRPWSEVESRYGSLQKLDLGSDADFLFPVWWGELDGPRNNNPISQ